MVKNLRPPVADLNYSVPEWIRALLPLCWAPLQHDRPDMAAVCEATTLKTVFVYHTTVNILFELHMILIIIFDVKYYL